MPKTIHDPRYHRLTAHLRSSRKKESLLQADVARHLGVSRTWVSKMESCELRVDILQTAHLFRLCNVRLADALRASGLWSDR